MIIIKPAIWHMASRPVTLSKHRTSDYMSHFILLSSSLGAVRSQPTVSTVVIVGLFGSKIVASLSTVLHHVNLCPLCLALCVWLRHM